MCENAETARVRPPPRSTPMVEVVEFTACVTDYC